MRYYDAKTDTMVEEVGDLTKRQWPNRMLADFSVFSKEEGICDTCSKPLKKWKGAFYGVISDCCTLYDREYSYKTGYCKECAKKEAESTRTDKHYTCPPVVSHVDNIRDDGFICEKTVYADGSVVESTTDSIRNAQRL